MFEGAKAFDKDISTWNTAKVETMASMFKGAEAYNTAIPTATNKWNTAKVTTMASMFEGAKAFNKDISTWDTALVEDMSSMLKGAEAYNTAIPSASNKWNTAA